MWAKPSTWAQPWHWTRGLMEQWNLVLHISESALTTPCDCPCHQVPPPKPTKLLFPATEANWQCLQMWLLNRSNTFNTCEHQPLPLKEGVPVRLMFDSNVEPAAHHTPIPVPLYWQTDVHDPSTTLLAKRCAWWPYPHVSLGVLKPVPVDKPVTWCYHTKPWWTVNFQALNLHIMWETHYMQSPFHQEWSVPSGTKKTMFDCWNGYHSVPLHPDDLHHYHIHNPMGATKHQHRWKQSFSSQTNSCLEQTLCVWVGFTADFTDVCSFAATECTQPSFSNLKHHSDGTVSSKSILESPSWW